MIDEKILLIVDKCINAKLSQRELQQISAISNTADFQETYLLMENLESVATPFGRSDLKKEIIIASKEYHKEAKNGRLKNISQWTVPAIAASVLLICSITVINTLTSYNNPKHFRKSYIEKLS
jgi:hypothetical protein